MFTNSKTVWTRVMFACLVTGMLALSLAPLASAAKHPKHRGDIKRVQESLRDKGYDPGPIDGVMGPQTRQAIGEYQRAEDLPVTQHLDAKTAGRLGVEQESVGGTFKAAGHDYAKGGKELGHDFRNGRPIEGGKDLGEGIGQGSKKVGEGVDKAVTP